MLALVKYAPGNGNVEVRDVPEPRCGEGQVKIEIAYCGICGTDLHVYHSTFRSYPPVTMGHEFAGTVVEVGSGASAVRLGDRVAVLPASAVTCGTCRYCRAGQFMFCPQRRGMGHGVNGAFTRYAVVRRDQVYALPPALSLEESALCEPFAAAVQPVLELNQIGLGDVVLISGPGPIGLMSLALLAAEGIKTIVVCTGRDGLRARAARAMGAACVVNVEEENLSEIVLAETRGEGVDFAFECAGDADSVANCLAALRPLGTYVQVGICGHTVPFAIDRVLYKQLQVKGSVGYTAGTWERMMRILEQGKVRLKELITHRFPLEQWREAFDTCEQKTGIKVLIAPNGHPA
jgi:L-iditol 2-dehydrogenase